MIIEKIGKYTLNKIHDEFICLDYTGEKIDHEGNKLSITLQVFENENSAKTVFNKVKALSENGKKSVHFGSFIRSVKDYYSN